MSQQPIARSADLSRLRNDGYTVRIVGAHLVVDDVPFVDSEGVVHTDGALVMALTLAGDVTTQPTDHTARFIGALPCHHSGKPLSHIINHTNVENLGDGLTTSCYLSAKPLGTGRYDDYHHKVTTYVGHIAGPANAAGTDTTARRYRPAQVTDDDGAPFKYLDTASSRAGIAGLNGLLSDERVGIIGLGGTGQYLLDLVAKTHVVEIHIYDGDDFLTHNAFRAPGAPGIEQLIARPLKVDHFGDIYDRMRNAIHRHPYPIDDTNVDELGSLTFVFVAIDDAEAKAAILEFLVEAGIAFVDVGMGMEVVDGRLIGNLRTTLGTPERSDHVAARVPTVSVHREEDAYRSNIQTAELNMSNASQAVVMWKKYRRFYADLDMPHHTMYSIASNRIANDEYAAEDEAEPEDSEAA